MTRPRERTDAVRPGLGLLLSGLAVVAGYSALVWLEIYGHSSDSHVCGGPHLDVYLPPATVCTPTGHAHYAVTSPLASAAGTVLFTLGAALALAGVIVLLLPRLRALRG